MRHAILFFSLASAFVGLVSCSGASAVLGGDDGGSSSGSSGGSSGGISSSSSGSGSGGGSGSSSGGGSGGGSGGSSGGGSGSSSGASPCNPTPPGDGGVCNSLSSSNAPVTLQCTSGSLPTPQGGPITNGTYVITAATHYGASCPATEVDRDRWLVCGTTWQTLQDNSTAAPTAENFNVTPSGTNLQLQGVCGVATSAPYTLGYSATSTTFSLIIADPSIPGEGRVDVYTLQ